MKILFIGCVESSARLLKKLLEINADIVGVITKNESKFNSDFVDLGLICQDNQINYIYTSNINDVESMNFIRAMSVDVAFCFGWSQLIKKDVIQLFPNGIIGFHPAELPYNKGRHPIIWALVLGLKKTASTFFMIDEKADTGNILSQRKIEIAYNDNANSLYNKIVAMAEEQIVEIVADMKKGKLECIQQTNEGNIWRKREKVDGKIDWRMSSNAIYNLVRGLTKPYVGAHFELNGNEYKVWKVQEVITKQYVNIEPGKILKVYEEGSFDVKAGDNIIRVISCDEVSVQYGEYL